MKPWNLVQKEFVIWVQYHKKAFQSNANRLLEDSTAYILNRSEDLWVGSLCSQVQVDQLWTCLSGVVTGRGVPVRFFWGVGLCGDPHFEPNDWQIDITENITFRTPLVCGKNRTCCNNWTYVTHLLSNLLSLLNVVDASLLLNEIWCRRVCVQAQWVLEQCQFCTYM